MIRRGKHQSDYSIVPNAISNDARLSFTARGLLLYLLAKPENWIVNVADLCKQGGIGSNKCYTLMGELEEAGYLHRERARDDGGRLGGAQYTVFDTPQSPIHENSEQVETPIHDLPDLDLPNQANGDAYKELNTTKDRKRKNTEAAPSLFEEKKVQKHKSKLPPECPSEEDRQKAKAYWNEKGRSDLCARLDVIADGFRAHHQGKGSLALDWGATWRTWYVNQINYTRAPAGYQAPRAQPTAENNREYWQRRLDQWVLHGSWHPDWGNPPDARGCEAPPDLLKAALAKRKVPA